MGFFLVGTRLHVVGYGLRLAGLRRQQFCTSLTMLYNLYVAGSRRALFHFCFTSLFLFIGSQYVFHISACGLLSWCFVMASAVCAVGVDTLADCSC